MPAAQGLSHLVLILPGWSSASPFHRGKNQGSGSHCPGSPLGHLLAPGSCCVWGASRGRGMGQAVGGWWALPKRSPVPHFRLTDGPARAPRWEGL